MHLCSLVVCSLISVVVNLLDKKMTVGKAVAAKRLHERLIPDTVDVEGESYLLFACVRACVRMYNADVWVQPVTNVL